MRADKPALEQAYVGIKVRELPSPACILNRTLIKNNCDAMIRNVHCMGASFRAHIKTHKTLEGAQLQLGSYGFGKLIVSTVMEAYSLLPLVETGVVTDILYGVPVVASRIPELAHLMTLVPDMRLMLDNEVQLDALVHYSQIHKTSERWSIFIKVDSGYGRAGLPPASIALESLIKRALSSELLELVSVYGFYSHAGHSYGAKSADTAKSLLLQEIQAANSAVNIALAVVPGTYTISVGATPTAHASSLLDQNELADLDLKGPLELHAGVYPFCDLQQVATSLVPKENVAIRVLSEVVSNYKDRTEMLINAGGLALSRETGPIRGFGNVTDPGIGRDWHVGRMSQEHGILVTDSETSKELSYGSKILLMPQHACITGAAYGWYYIVDEDGLNAQVVDIWVRFNGW